MWIMQEVVGMAIIAIEMGNEQQWCLMIVKAGLTKPGNSWLVPEGQKR